MPSNSQGIFLRYLWFIIALSGIINYCYAKYRVQKALGPKDPDTPKMMRFLFQFLCVLTIPYFLVGVLQLIGGFESPFFIFSQDYQNTYLALAWMVIIGTSILVAKWVLFQGGANILVEFNSIMRNKAPGSETVIKFWAVVAVVFLLVFLIVGSVSDWASQINLR